MILLQVKLAELLFRQSWNDVQKASLSFEELSPWLRDKYLKHANEIIELFTDAIKNLKFESPKHYHEKINSAFVFPPCKSFKGEIKV